MGLPAFAWNQSDPLWLFNDAAVHVACLAMDPRRAHVERVIAEVEAKTGPGNRVCAVCGDEVTDPEDYILIPRLTHIETDPLFRFRYTHLHKSHVPQWREYAEFMGHVPRLVGDVPSVTGLIDELEQARSPRRS